MKPWMSFTLKLVGSLTALLVAVGGILTSYQGGVNKTKALRAHDRAWQEHQHAVKGNVGSFDKAKNPYLAAIADSAEQAARDTGKALVQPTTLGRMFGQKARLVSVKALRNVPPRPAGIHEE